MTHVSLAATAAYLPERVMTAAEVGGASGIPEPVIVEKFGLRGKHIAADDEHVSDLSVRAARDAARGGGHRPESIDVVMYFGSMWKDYARLAGGALDRAPHRRDERVRVEYDNVSCGTPVALRIARDMLARGGRAAARARRRRLPRVVPARLRQREVRFMFNFGDGAVAGLLVKDGGRNALLGCYGITDGSFSLQVKVPSGGSVSPNGGYRFLDVADPAAMKDGLDQVSLPNFVAAARRAPSSGAARRSTTSATSAAST